MRDAGAALGSAFIIQAGGTLTLDNSGTACGDRIGDTIALTMNGGNLNLIGSATTSTYGLAGAVTFSVGLNIITVTPGAGGATTMAFQTYAKSAGAIVLFRGTNLGSTPGAGVSTIIFLTPPTLTGGMGFAGTTTVSIIRGAFGDASLTGTGTDMVTYNVGNANGVRLLNGAGFTGEYLLNNLSTTNANVRLTQAVMANTIIINSLILDSGGSIIDAPVAITFTTGNIIALTGNKGLNCTNTILAFGAAEACILNTSNLTIPSLITGSAGLSKIGTGTLTLSFSNQYTGLTMIGGGTLAYGTDNAILSGNVTIFNATLDLAGHSDLIGALTMWGGSITTGAGTLTLGGDVTGSIDDTGATIYGNLNLGGATRTFTVADGVAADDMIIYAVISNTAGPFGLTKGGAGELTLANANTYTGATTITTGTLSVSSLNNGGLPSNIGASTSDAASLVLNGGTLLYTGPADTIDRLFSITTGAVGGINCYGTGALTFSNTGGMGLTGTTSRTFTVGGTSDLSLACIIADVSNGIATTVVNYGTGNLILSGANLYTGNTTVNAGTLTIQNSTALGSSVTGTTTIVSGATLQIDGTNLIIAEQIASIIGTGVGNGGALRNIANNNTWSGTIALGALGATIDCDGGNLTVTGIISGAQPLTKIGVGTLTLSAINTYSGITYVTAGIISYGVNYAIAGGNIVVNGGTYDINGHFDTVGGITLTSGTIADTAGGGALIGTSYVVESGTISAILSNAATAYSLNKNTAGTVTITSPCSYTGTTTINAGTLILKDSGSIVPTTGITIQFGGTLTLDNSGTNNTNRIPDGLTVTMQAGANFNFIGSPTTDAYETAGQLSLVSGVSAVTVTPGAGGVTVLTFASYSRTVGATVLFRGTNLGSTPGANVSNILFATAPALATGGSGAAGTTTVNNLTGAFGDVSLTGTGTDMVTYNVGNSNGLRLLNGAGFTGEYLLDSFATNANVMLTRSTQPGANVTINSLILASGGYVDNDPVNSWTITFTAAGNIVGLIDNAGINGAHTTIKAASAGELSVLTSGNLIVSSVIADYSTSKLTKAGDAALIFNAVNTYASTTYINAGTLSYNVDNAIAGGGVTIVTGTYDLNGHLDIVGAINMTGGSITTDTTSTAGKLTLTGDITTNLYPTSAK